ncbi:hypothetical protein [Reichenbachiella sp.]|uniref:hypothetical protein n=1 Tax=Reichenbachiella sp. TaxID=2184521 RepID=UPI0032991A1B
MKIFGGHFKEIEITNQIVHITSSFSLLKTNNSLLRFDSDLKAKRRVESDGCIPISLPENNVFAHGKRNIFYQCKFDTDPTFRSRDVHDNIYIDCSFSNKTELQVNIVKGSKFLEVIEKLHPTIDSLYNLLLPLSVPKDI